MRFSIITPLHIYNEEKSLELVRCIESVRKQFFGDDFEHILVNDGSTHQFEIPNYEWIRIINQSNLQRMEAYNAGFRASKGEIICMLDSDDEYDTSYLGAVDWMFINNPDYKMFNFGCKYVNKNGTEWNRGAFKPKKLKVGHEVFGGGNIVNGTFVFHRSIYEDLGAFPPPQIEMDCTEINYSKGKRILNTASPYDFSAYYQMKYPEIREHFMVAHSEVSWKIIKELGNPFGQDFALFYQYTRKYWSKPVDKYLLIVHPR